MSYETGLILSAVIMTGGACLLASLAIYLRRKTLRHKGI